MGEHALIKFSQKSSILYLVYNCCFSFLFIFFLNSKISSFKFIFLNSKISSFAQVFLVANVCQVSAVQDLLRPVSPQRRPAATTTAPNQDNKQISSLLGNNAAEKSSGTPPTTTSRFGNFCFEHKMICCPCKTTSSSSSLGTTAYEPQGRPGQTSAGGGVKQPYFGPLLPASNGMC